MSQRMAADLFVNRRHIASYRQVIKVGLYCGRSVKPSGVGIIMKGNESPYPVKLRGLGAIRIMPGSNAGLNRLYQFRKLAFHLARNHPVEEPVPAGNYFLGRMFFRRCHRGWFLRDIARQKHLVQDPQRMFRLPDLSVCDAPAFSQVSQKGFNILPRPVFEGIALEETVKLPRPSDVEGRTLRPRPVFLRARPVSFPKTLALFGIVGILDFPPKNPFNFRGLCRNESHSNNQIIISHYNCFV